MSALQLAAAATLLGCLTAGACRAQGGARMVISSDVELVELAESLLPDLVRRSGLELLGPVRLERRSRAELVRYLEAKLDEELPAEEARATVEAYALLGLVPAGLDLRELLLALYTEQVAGFYEPDSTALFVMDDQPRAALEGLLVHELVHAIQDQNADLASITDRDLGNDRAVAALAAIEGHATLVMLEHLTEQLTGAPVDLAELPDFAAQMRPAIEAMRGQFPALSRAPRVVRESILFPYLEGTGFVQSLWTQDGRVAPFGERLPHSTEQVLERDGAAPPLEIRIVVTGARTLHEDVLGRLEVGLLLDEHGGAEGAGLAAAWDGDRYALVERPDGGRGLLWYAVWEDEPSRDGVADVLGRALSRFGEQAAVERTALGGRPATLFRVGALEGVTGTASARHLP